MGVDLLAGFVTLIEDAAPWLLLAAVTVVLVFGLVAWMNERGP